MNKRYFFLIVLLSLVVAVAATAWLYIDITEERLRVLIRWSAKFSVVLFSIAFSASSVHYFLESRLSRHLVRLRPDIGLSFTVFHTAHLIFLGMLQCWFHPVFDLAKNTSLLGGGMAYVFMYLMAITTFPAVRAKISNKLWNILHVVGAYWIWIIFFRSYFKNVVNKGEAYFLFSVIALAMVLRVSRLIIRSVRKT